MRISRRDFLAQQASALIGLGAVGRAAAQTGVRAKFHTTTDWRLAPSLGLDALCLLNTLTGDPYYTAFYGDDFATFEPKLTTDARRSLASLKRRIKDDNHDIVSAFLCSTFSAIPTDTLDDLIDGVSHPERIQRALEPTPYYSKAGWQQFLAVRADLAIVFRFLKDIRFDAYWRSAILPKIQDRIRIIEPRLATYNVVAEDETVLGAGLPSNQITVFVLNYNHPHGIRLTGTRFVSGVSWPIGVVVNNAAHEMLHPPYDLRHDKDVRAAVASLRNDAFVMERVTKHNPSFGYNSLEGFIEENCVRALDQLVTETLGTSREPRQRWAEEDDGIHVFAVALYSVMQQDHFVGSGEPFRDYFVRTVRSGSLQAGRIASVHAAFYRG